MNWFERLTGFPEAGYEATRERLGVDGEILTSRINGRSFGIGSLEILSLRELRHRGRDLGLPPGRLRVSTIIGDARSLHQQKDLAGALFQVASQFNLLEMVSPMVTPEDGVARYEQDHTQGPACAIAAGAATIYRNYFVPVNGQEGQTATRQIDCLGAIGSRLGNGEERLWEMKNGYALCSGSGLRKIRAKLLALSEEGLDALRSELQIGVHWNVEVTDGDSPATPRVSQAFCSALPVAYARHPADEWREFATLVLEAAYEATFWAAALNSRHFGSKVVLLTRLGGGAFGNEPEWIQKAMLRAMSSFRQVDLDVRLVCRGAPDRDSVRLVEAFRGE